MSTPSPDQPQVAAPSPAQTRWFVEEVEPHGSSLRAYLRSRFPWLMDVDDIAQEALLRLWRRCRRNEVADVKSPKAALFAIARNAALDLGRRRAMVAIEASSDIERLAAPDERADIAEAISTRQELEVLADAMRDLPDRCRQVLTLTKLYGYSQKEVAERLGISEFTVRAQVAKGMRRCADYLRHRGIKRSHSDVGC